MNVDPYLQFLSYCIDDSLELPESAKNMDWKKLMVWAERQSIVGIVYYGIEKSGKSLSIPFDILVQWVGYSQMIEAKSRLVNNRCVEICKKFDKEGFETCILKGQGNAMMYPKSLLRTPGDIDLYVSKKLQKSLKYIIRYVKGYNPKGRALYHHIDYGEYKGVEVEVHYRPSFMLNPIHNYRLQRWFMIHDSRLMVELPEDVGKIPVPSVDFNIVFQLSHVYNHLLHEGIGLRQIIDYYYVLKSDVKSKREEIAKTLAYLGLEKIAGAMMWILNEVLGLPEEYLILPKDEKRGRMLLAEIMKGGNFGHHDTENQKANNAFKKNLQRIKRDIRMMRYFPSECLWEPVFRIYHFFWRLKN